MELDAEFAEFAEEAAEWAAITEAAAVEATRHIKVDRQTGIAFIPAITWDPEGLKDAQ